MVYSLDGQDQINRGAEVNFDTIRWWLKQSRAAQSLTFENETRPVTNPKIVLENFNFFLTRCAGGGDLKDVYLWSNGALADIRWLESLYKAYEVEEYISFRNKMCYRTIRNLIDWKGPEIPESVKHDCLSDTIYQVIQLQMMFEAMRNKNV